MEKLKPEQVVDLLRKKGVEVSVEQALLVLEFLKLLAKVMIRQYLKKN